MGEIPRPRRIAVPPNMAAASPPVTYQPRQEEQDAHHQPIAAHEIVAATKGAPCRLQCGCGEDRLSHLHACPEIQSLFRYIEDPPSPQLIYLGLQRDLRPLTGGLSMLYTLIWKFTLIAYTRADTDGEPFDQTIIIRNAVRRFSTRLEACSAE